MTDSYDLTKLDPDTFEHMVNALALAVLGAGVTGFGPGSDGGRDGYFEGEAPYPSESTRWNGIWYIQSKFHRPHLSHDAQKWLLEQIENELDEFRKPDSRRQWPHNWIIATNIDPSGVPLKGTFDKANELVAAARPELRHRFHIWGGAKLLNLLDAHQHVAQRYAHFLTPGHVLSQLLSVLTDERADLNAILHHLVVTQFKDHKSTKLEQAGSQADVKPSIHDLFVDLPFYCAEHSIHAEVMSCFAAAARECHLVSQVNEGGPEWRKWARHPRRARVWFLEPIR